MCGIVGFFGKGDQQDLAGMTQSLTHRGPDEEGFFRDSNMPLYFGHRRLVIRDEIGGCQPMKTLDGKIIVVYNGEIYNSSEIRKELESKGHIFQSDHSDTEVLLYGYKEWGDRFVERLNGMWAFAILDRKNKKILLSRDRFGQKPLFYTFQNNIFAFASEIKAFRKHRALTLTISPKGLQKYHAYGYFPGKHTIYSEIIKLPGGCNLTFDLEDFNLTVKRYWSYRVEPEYDKKEEYWVNETRHLLIQSVQRRLVSDVPLGVFLSGGLDSSAIAAFAKENLNGNTLDSFSVRFLYPSFDETEYALLASDFLGTRHSTVTFSPEELPSVQNEMLSLLDEPFSDSSMMSYYILCRHARKKVTVALGGDAGDELFAGYNTFQALGLAKLIQRFVPRPCHQGILSMLALLPLSHSYMNFRFRLERLLKGYGKPESLWNPVWLGPVSPQEISTIIGEPVALEELYSDAIELWDQCKAGKSIDRSLEFYGNLFLQDQILVKVDRISMMHNLEVRTPLLDIDLINCVRRIPSKLKLKGNHEKYILRKSVEPYLPAKIVWRKKLGFSAPLARWFSDGSIEFRLGQHWNKDSRRLIQQKIDAHKSLQTDHRLFLWNCYLLNEVVKNNDK